jgi:hypothetical protein
MQGAVEADAVPDGRGLLRRQALTLLAVGDALSLVVEDEREQRLLARGSGSSSRPSLISSLNDAAEAPDAWLPMARLGSR